MDGERGAGALGAAGGLGEGRDLAEEGVREKTEGWREGERGG